MVVYSDGNQEELDIDELLPWWAKTSGSTYLGLRNYETMDVDIRTPRVELTLMYMRSEGGKLAKRAEQLCAPGHGLKHVLDEVPPPKANNEVRRLAPLEVAQAIEQMEALAAAALANNKKAQEKQAQRSPNPHVEKSEPKAAPRKRMRAVDVFADSGSDGE